MRNVEWRILNPNEFIMNFDTNRLESPPQNRNFNETGSTANTRLIFTKENPESVELGAVDISTFEARRPAACPRDPEGLHKAKACCTGIDRTGSREQVAGCRNLKCQQPLQKILLLLKNVTGYDFFSYKFNPLLRRIQKQLDSLQIDTLTNYVYYLQQHPQEITRLCKRLLIQSTHFFRDPDAFELLKNKILSTMSTDYLTDRIYRVWIPGCSTGEEAYSLAIVIQECMNSLNLQLNVRIFATDINADTVDTARSGVFSKHIENRVSQERLQAFFTKKNDLYKINGSIRKMIVFASHNIITDPPFTKLNLICCRNLLIYLNRSTQNNVLSSFCSCLSAHGLLLLGPSENVGRLMVSFNIIDVKWRLYELKKSEPLIQPSIGISSTTPLPAVNEVNMTAKISNPDEHKLSILVKKLISKHYTPAFIIIDKHGDIMYIYGRTSKFLELASGDLQLHFMSMIRPELKSIFNIGIRKAFTQKKEVQLNGLHVADQYVNVKISPITEEEANQEDLLLIIIEEISPSESLLMSKSSSYVPSYLQNELCEKKAQIADEIQQMQHTYQSIIEDQEASNEELRSINEEACATYEESNSLNEELSSLNNELENRLESLATAKHELEHLLNLTGIASICVDRNLCIKRFTPKATDIFNLIPSDIGRPLNHLVSNLQDNTLIDNLRTALTTMETVESKGVDQNGHCYLIRVIPYRSENDTNASLIISFLSSHDHSLKQNHTT